jgi:hypothetical protein
MTSLVGELLVFTTNRTVRGKVVRSTSLLCNQFSPNIETLIEEVSAAAVGSAGLGSPATVGSPAAAPSNGLAAIIAQ